MLLHLQCMLDLIIENYFNSSLCILHYHENIDNFVHLSKISTYSINGYEHLHLDRQQFCKDFLVQHENANIAFSSLEDAIKIDNNIKYNYRKYIFILNNPEELNSFYKSNLLTFVRDVLVIVPHYYYENENIFEFSSEKVTKFDLYTHQFIGVIGNNDPILLDTWFSTNFSFKFNNNLFPDKITNQLGREFRAPCFHHIPYVDCRTGTIQLHLIN